MISYFTLSIIKCISFFDTYPLIQFFKGVRNRDRERWLEIRESTCFANDGHEGRLMMFCEIIFYDGSRINVFEFCALRRSVFGYYEEHPHLGKNISSALKNFLQQILL